MDDPFNSILFAEDLIHFVLFQNGLEWPTELGIRNFRITVGKSRFNTVIGRCVLDIMKVKAYTIKRCYDALLQKEVLDSETFRFECMISAVFHFSRGYDHELYLNLCALLAGLTVLYFKDGYEDIASGASHVLAYVLNFYIYQLQFNVRNDYFNLAVRAQIVRRRLVKVIEDMDTKTKGNSKE